MEHCFPVSFAMEFTEQLAVYRVVGSAPIPDAESLAIPLMREQIHGTPIRISPGDDWGILTWQNLEGRVVPFMPFISFMLLAKVNVR